MPMASSFHHTHWASRRSLMSYLEERKCEIAILTRQRHQFLIRMAAGDLQAFQMTAKSRAYGPTSTEVVLIFLEPRSIDSSQLWLQVVAQPTSIEQQSKR